MEAVVAIWARKPIRQSNLVKRVLDNQPTKRDEYIKNFIDTHSVQNRLYATHRSINFRNDSFYLYGIKIGMAANYIVIVRTREPILDVYA